MAPAVETLLPSVDGPQKATAPETPSTTSSAIVGIIYPPPEVRNIVDKTASFVARNGSNFEALIRQKEINNSKFNFLNQGDPYNAYYQHKVKEFGEGKAGEVQPFQPQQRLPPGLTGFGQLKLQDTPAEPFVPTEPPPEYEFTYDPPSISAQELDIVKLTAQFAARNGRQFLTRLMSQEQRNYQFDFLRPQHSLFAYFTKLLEQYTKVLIPPKDVLKKLEEESCDPAVVLKQVKLRADYFKYEEAQKRKEDEELEKERVAYAQIDWHDFVVVEAVDYQPDEAGNFPPPTLPDKVGARVLLQDRAEDGEEEGQEGEGEEDGASDKEEGSGEEMEDVDAAEDDGAGGKETDEEGEGEGEDGEIMRVKGKDKGKGRRDVRRRKKDENNEESDVEEEGQDEEMEDANEREADTRVQDMEEDSSDESDDEIHQPAIPPSKSKLGVPPVPPPPPKDVQPPPLPPNPEQVIIKKGYDPKTATKTQALNKPGVDEYLISPITGEKIPATKVQEHMRIGLLDPRWIEEKDRMIHEKLNQEAVYAAGSSIEQSLKLLAERRTDIFGEGDVEAAIGKKIGEEENKKDDKVTWDGHSSSIEAATRAARSNITLEDQIQQIHKVKGLLPDEEKERIGPQPGHSAPPGTVPIRFPGMSLPTPPVPSALSRPVPPPPASNVESKQSPVLTSNTQPQPKVQNIQIGPPGTIPLQRQMVPPQMPPMPVGIGSMSGQVISAGPPGMVVVGPGIGVGVGSTPPQLLIQRPQFTSGGVNLPGFVPGPPMSGMPGMPPQPQPPPPNTAAPGSGPCPPPALPTGIAQKHPAVGQIDDEPQAKKQRTEETLIPEADFLANNPAQVTFSVQLPLLNEKAEWKLNGQKLSISLPLSDMISVVKAKIHEEIGMPPGKQKLQWDGLFFKDSYSLAYYNVSPGTTLLLQLKERGGRKK